jgi:hypothetical protein
MCGLFRPDIEKGSNPARLIDQEPGYMQSRTITLFAEAPSARRGPSGFLVSALVHVLAICAIYIYMKETVRVTDLVAKQRYTVRLINVEPPRLRTMRSGGSGGESSSISAAMTHSPDPGGEAASPLIRRIARPVHAAQPLVQPDLPPDLLARQVPLPQVVIWSPGSLPAVTITPPRPQIANTPISTPSLESPNSELQIADVKISAKAFSPTALTLPPSTTAPLVVKRPSLPAQMPTIASSAVGPATPARVISLSDVQLAHGTIALPALNEVGAANGVNDPTAEKALAGSNSNSTGKPNASGTGNKKNDRDHNGSAAGGDQLASAGAGGQGTSQGHGGGNDGDASGNEGDGTGAGEPGTASVTELRQPMDGQFGAVVVGASIAEKYPETMQLWAGRLAYTVYLHVGLQKNWILQYAVVRDASKPSGNATQPHAPWPYLMERPTLSPGDFDSDAVMVHGLLNTSGHFEGLAVVFPTDFSQAKFVLSALQQWRFRPALQDGKIIAVEVLLIIPEED